ncbi:Molecular co-chaperone STI1 domain-containing protein [Dioscorea alata]|uniref:Molecular co-chaperone STI1 domain-containing protein n=1 Tax=Dioscorea alata TaxID=55571 RepID=A0ACB7WG10_DIOAL|nr:Molecular co-chaperone STI1 domain-containing protein [Dioscorea alata]
MADEAIAKGDAAFSAGDFEEAIDQFTEAIKRAPTDHVVYSKRSAVHAVMGYHFEAVGDALKIIDLKPDLSEGYLLVGSALVGAGYFNTAIAFYKKGLELHPCNEALNTGLAEAEALAEQIQGFTGASTQSSSHFSFRSSSPELTASRLLFTFRLFSMPNLLEKLAEYPTTKEYIQQPDFLKMVKDVQENPSNLDLYVEDPRMMETFGVLIGLVGFPLELDSIPAHQKRKPEESEGARERRLRKAMAQIEKEEGNGAYKKKDFEKAIKHYDKALVLDDEDISFLTNRAAVHMEMGEYAECIRDCDKAVERGRELKSDFKMIARALTRKGTAFVKLAKVSKDYDAAIESFQKALIEHRNPDTIKKLNNAENAKKELEQQEYYDPKIADEEREKGNEFARQQKYPEAVEHYTEALRRNSKDLRV